MDELAWTVAPEAIVVVDIVESTLTSDMFGWYAVGRVIFRELRELIGLASENRGLTCLKSTGDGFLLSFRHNPSAEIAVVNAWATVKELFERVARRNAEAQEERRINLRAALHFGEVDVLPNDREGPNVSYTFRIESVNKESLAQAMRPMPDELFPESNYLMCSERAAGILMRRLPDCPLTLCGTFKLKGFSGAWDLYLVSLVQVTSAIETRA
jgi:class 3 adenylate cyclase